jgi:predicted nucleotidyltransferase
MTSLFDQHRQQIQDVCGRHHVRRLDVFGSALRDDFEPSRSDVDLLVEFEPGHRVTLRSYFQLREKLSQVLGYPVDLVMASAVQNRYIKADIEATRELVYAA